MYEMLKWQSVPTDLQDRTHRHIDILWNKTRGADPRIALKLLPRALRVGVLIEMCESTLRQMPDFKNVFTFQQGTGWLLTIRCFLLFRVTSSSCKPWY